MFFKNINSPKKKLNIFKNINSPKKKLNIFKNKKILIIYLLIKLKIL